MIRLLRLTSRFRRVVVRSCTFGAMVFALSAAPAGAQTPVLSLQASPSPFGPSASINIDANVGLQAVDYFPFCQSYPCVVLSVYTSAAVSASNGFYAFADSWGDWAQVQTADGGPGQSMQATTYTLTGEVIVTYCDYDIHLGDCGTPPQQYVEWGQTQATVQPAPAPSADSVSPSSGSSLSATFTVAYSSTAGASDISTMHFWFNPSQTLGTAAWSCYVVYARASHSLRLYTDNPSTYTSATVGTATTLQNSQCAIDVGAASAVASGPQWTIHVPVTFAPGWVGSRWMYMYAESNAGVDSGWQLGGTWTVPCTATVTPAPTWLSSASGTVSFTINTPSPCGWSAPSTSDFLSLTSPASGTGPGQVTYAYPANTGIQARSTSPEVAGQLVDVTQKAPAGDVAYYHLDGLGSVRLITDAGGQPISTNNYLPFGSDWQPTGPLDSQSFAGMERSPATGGGSWQDLSYAGARYYSSQAGRFISPDASIYIDPSDPQTWNLYAYVLNNPLRYVDPTGQYEQCTNPAPDCFRTGNEPIDDLMLERMLRDLQRDIDLLEHWLRALRDRTWDYLLRPVFMPETPGEIAASVALNIGAALVTGGTSAVAAGGARAGAGIAVASSGRQAPMTIVRLLPKGTAGGVVNEAKALTFVTGNEHAVVRLATGQRALVSGGPGGITFAEGQITRIIGHTHPYGYGSLGPSAADLAALRALGQTHSYILDGAGKIIRFGP